MKLETLKPGISLVGIEPTLIASVIAVVPIGDGAVQVLYKTPDGTIKERLLSREPMEAELRVGVKIVLGQEAVVGMKSCTFLGALHKREIFVR